MLLTLILLLIVAAGMAAFLVVGVVTGWRSVGFVPMPARAVERMVRLSEVELGERTMDLGSGDGRVARAFAKLGARAEGVEMQPVLVGWSRALAARRHDGITGECRPQFYWGDLWKVDLGPYDVVTAYAFPRMMEGLEEKFTRELKPGARVVLYTFPLPHWQPVKMEGKVFVYVKEGARTQDGKGARGQGARECEE